MIRSKPAVLDPLDQFFVDFLVGLDDDFAGKRIDDIFQRYAAEHTVAERLDDLAALHERRDLDAIHSAAIFFADDGVLRDVDETARQVAGIGGFQSRIRETFARAVGRDKVLQHGQTFAEVRRDRRLDDFAGRFRHQTAHTGQLANLLRAAAGAGVGHHENRIEARHRKLRGPCSSVTFSEPKSRKHFDRRCGR